MKHPDTQTPNTIGICSLLVIFSVLCLVVFSVLCMSTVLAQKRLSDASIQAVEKYYQADLEAERIFADLRNGKCGSEIAVSDGIYSYSCPVSEHQCLLVEVQPTDSGWMIHRWQVVVYDQEIEQTLQVWNGA